jgi:mRNA interferase RelE/StbE
VVITVDEHEALEETAEILSDDATLAAIQRGLDDLAADDVMPLKQVRDEQALRHAVLDALCELERDPMVGHALCGRLTGLRSYRVGVYRIIYETRDAKTVPVIAIHHRGEAYESVPR